MRFITRTFAIFWIAFSYCDGSPGKLDTSFAPVSHGRVWAIAPTSDNKLLVASDKVRRLNQDGSEDSGFVCPISTASLFDSINLLAPSQDAGAVVAGSFEVNADHGYAARILANGNLDPTYHSPILGPQIPSALVTAAAIDAKGRLILAGPFHQVNGVDESYIARFLSDGTRDETFAATLSEPPNALASLPDGRIVIGTSSGVSILQDNGTADSTARPYTAVAPVSAIAVSASGEIAVTGRFSVRLLHEDLSEDSMFAPTFGFQLGTDDAAFMSDGSLLVSGAFGSQPTQFGVVRFLSNGSVDSSWSALGEADNRIEHIRLAVTGDAYISGRFSSVAGSPRAGLARLHGSSTGAIRWTNTSARATISAGQPLILGIVVTGDEPIQVLVRAVGPSLQSLNVSSPAQDPQIAVYSGNSVVSRISSWTDNDQMRAAVSAVGAFPLTSVSDAAAIVTLLPGAYTVLITDSAATPGTVLGEVYKFR